MISFLPRVVVSVGVVMATLSSLGPGIGVAEPSSRASDPVDASARAAARRLVDEGIAAQDASDY